MRKFKKVVGLVLGAALLLNVAGCTASPKQKPEEPKKDDVKVEDKTDAPEESTAINMDETYDVDVFLWGAKDVDPNDEIIAALNEKFNINLNVERLLAKEYDQALELRIASGDMPDIFRIKSTAPHIYNNLQQDDYLVNFSDYIDKYDYQETAKFLEKDGMAPFAEPDGFYQLPSFRGSPAIGFMFRQDWLEQVGMEQPKTLDEMKAMLVAFKDQKLGGKNTIPLTMVYGTYEPIEHLITLFTGVNEWAKVDGEWTYEFVLDETKDALKMLNEWYNEGLIDPESFTQNETQANAKIINGTAGMTINGMDRYPLMLRDALLAANPDANLSMLVPLPAGPAGGARQQSRGLGNPMVMIKKGRDQAFLDRVMMLVDYIHTEEGIDLLQNGIEGIHYTMDGDKMVRTDIYERDTLVNIGHILAMITDYSGANDHLTGIEKENYEDGLKTAVGNPFEIFTNETVQEVRPTIRTVFDQYMIDFITGGKNIDQHWDEYVKELNDSGLDVWTEEITTYAQEKGIE